MFLVPFYLALTIMKRVGVYTPITLSALNHINGSIKDFFTVITWMCLQ
jgi:hypothetical protein